MCSTTGNTSAPWRAHLPLQTACPSQSSNCFNTQFQQFPFFRRQEQQALNAKTIFICNSCFYSDYCTCILPCSFCVNNMNKWVSSKLTLYKDIVWNILCETHCVPQVVLFHTDRVGRIMYAYAGTCMLICSRKWDLPLLCCFAVSNICMSKYECTVEIPKT